MKIFIKRFSIFVLFLGVFYVLTALALTLIGARDQTLMRIATRNPVTPGEFGYTLERFRDIDQYENVDILFLGSSHCYRTFDPRVYAEQGLKVFNMGSTGQTPLNSYYLLKNYFEHLDPKLVVFDLNYRVINRDGLESFYDLVVNIPPSRELLEMAFSIHNPHAINGAIGRLLQKWAGLLPDEVQNPQENRTYIPGGYVEFSQYLQEGLPAADSLELERLKAEVAAAPSRTVEPYPGQLSYISQTIRFAKSKGAKIILITKPEPAYNREAVDNYQEINDMFAYIAGNNDVRYVDFNRIALPLHPLRHFHDKEYLNPFGVRIFNEALIDWLRNAGLI